MSEPAEPDQHIVRSWVANAPAWTRTVRDGRIESRRVATDKAIVAAILDCAPKSVLDVGCGEGWLCRALAEHGIGAVGVDGSEPLIDAARAQGGRFHVLSYEVLASEPQRLGAERFDLIACNFALLQADLASLLRSLRQLLHPTGALIIQTVHPWSARGDARYADGWRTETFANFGDDFREPMPWYYRTLGSWVRALGEAHFHIQEIREPLHPESGSPLSLLLVARSA